MTAPTAQEMGEQLLTLFQHAKLQPEREDPAERRDNQLVAQVQSYIRENYQDPFLNVSLIKPTGWGGTFPPSATSIRT